MTYGAGRYFMPTTLRLGTGITYRFGEHGRFTWVLDAQKLMVPPRPGTNCRPTATRGS
jgi:hypothetical protein